MLHSSDWIKRFASETEAENSHDEAKVKLFEKYKRSKAARLLGFWLHVHLIGIDAAKKSYGKSSFYAAQADLKAAGVDLSRAALKVVETSPVEPIRVVPTDNRCVKLIYLESSNSFATPEEVWGQDEED